jgi:hypothetical protein
MNQHSERGNFKNPLHQMIVNHADLLAEMRKIVQNTNENKTKAYDNIKPKINAWDKDLIKEQRIQAKKTKITRITQNIGGSVRKTENKESRENNENINSSNIFNYQLTNGDIKKEQKELFHQQVQLQESLPSFSTN